MSDRTGELCPFCKKGKLYKTGGREILKPKTEPKSGEFSREFTEYECDVCHKKTKALGHTLTGTISTSVEVTVTDNKTINNKKSPE